MNRQGFTITEMLAVVAVIGILVAVAIPNLTRSLNMQRASLAAQQVAESVTDARNNVRKKNVCYQLFFNTPTSYVVNRFKDRNCSGTPVAATTMNYPNGTVLAALNGVAATTTTTQTTSNTINFVTPYGTNGNGTPFDLTLASSAGSSIRKSLRITGALGTVILK